ncbi:MAG TPA: DUF4922 domain-containing protein [Syntrophorhabdaceae bacterium]|nr:DUF4922 domain-containing protein [Syntrophorhabdaceae bacterium]HQM82933.1 DUF4922 domain-containing protein [Syntrophorhabdaceae bacterium]
MNFVCSSAVFNGKKGKQGLPLLCIQLIAGQERSWPELAQAHRALADVRTRDVVCDGFTVRLQHNPGRTVNSIASVNRQDIKARACFLCAESLPQEQKGILYRDEYLILCNPRPVFHSHLTVTYVRHIPQAIAGSIDALLQLAADLGSGWAVLYNGPQCGASAPDHLHFQAVPSGQMPIEKETVDKKRLAMIAEVDGIPLARMRGMGREIMVLTGDNPSALGNAFKKLLNSLQRALCINEEPMMNIAAFYEDGTWRLLIFPRQKHRPDVFFREDDERVVVSPAVIEMGGVIVAPMEKDFERIDAPLVEGIFREVSLDATTVDGAVAKMLLATRSPHLSKISFEGKPPNR